jgi:hypothetical protein
MSDQSANIQQSSEFPVQRDYEMDGSDSLCADNSGFNLNSKMIGMQGYQFNHNMNHQAMQKIIDQKSSVNT